jgi:hypothetical protein
MLVLAKIDVDQLNPDDPEDLAKFLGFTEFKSTKVTSPHPFVAHILCLY